MVVIRSRRVVRSGGVGPAAILLEDGKIARVAAYGDAPVDAVDYGDLVVMPGLVDSHVHVNEPGRTEWEGFDSATRAAAAGGVTTIVDMPLNSIPPTTTVPALLAKTAAMEGKLWVDVALWGGLVPDNRLELVPLLDVGLAGFKCFLVDSGVPEFPPVTTDDLIRAAQIIAVTDRPILVHAELPESIGSSGPTYRKYLKSRPPVAEENAVELLHGVSKRTMQRLHVVHLSAAGAVETIRTAKEEGLPFSAETAPHYLTFSAEEIPERATEYKCAPPIRNRENRERLWDALSAGLIDMVVSDHSPAPAELKRGDFSNAWGGIASLQFTLAVMWSEASRRGFSPVDLARWMSERPAALAGLKGRKGSIAPGYDADLAVLDPEERFRVEPSRILHRHKGTPYAGRELRGVVKATWLRGRVIYEDGVFNGSAEGEWLRL